ncbi:MAG: DUF6036 family nucleotidyltransferase [Acidobacteriaceae bacterium]
MTNRKRLPEPWNSFLRDLDAIVTGLADLHCIGGFVITRRFGFARETADIDVLSITPNEQTRALIDAGAKGSALHKKHKVYLDHVTAIQYYPEDYEQRLAEMYPGQLKRIRLLAPDAYDLALMKLDRNIERDREDVKFLAREGFIQGEELKRRYEKEMRPYVAHPEDRLDRNFALWLEMIDEQIKANDHL